MGQFKGSNTRVRCIDCVKLDGTHCTAKDASVAPKKRRHCTVYAFKGEYDNRVPAEGVYRPYMDKKTRKIIQRLIKSGVVSVAGEGSVETRDGFVRVKALPMPITTATASPHLTTISQENPLLSDPNGAPPADEGQIWTPE